MKNLQSIVLCLLFLSAIALSAQTAVEQIGKSYLSKHYKSMGLSSKDVENTFVSDVYTSKHNGITHLYLQQEHAGIPVDNAQINLAIDNEGKVRHAANRLEVGVAFRASSETPSLTAEMAAGLALEIKGIAPGNLRQLEAPQGKTQSQSFVKDKGVKGKIACDLRYLPVENAQIRLVWAVNFEPSFKAHWWTILVDASNGDVLKEYDWIVSCSFDQGHNHSGKSCGLDHFPNVVKNKSVSSPTAVPQPVASPAAPNSYNVYAFPVESPSHGERSIVTAPWNQAGDASFFGWHGNGNQTWTITRGNNVYASEDIDDNDIPGYSPQSPTLDFDYPLDLGTTPSEYLDAAITNLFYANNMMHDILYQYGFDEVSGNFQDNNRGLGGQGGDFVYADAQDGSGTNNANFGTPPEGQNPRMQMFEWSSSLTEFLTIGSPAVIDGGYIAVEAGFDPPLPTTPLTGEVVQAYDAGSDPVTLLCGPAENADEINGNIALIDRGECFFTDKITRAQDAGAIACIICNNIPGDGAFGMGANNPAGINIPSVMISFEDCLLLKEQLENGETIEATLQKDDAIPNLDSDIDNGVIAHEYCHGISTRLTGGSSNSNCLVSGEQMGEGWSDFYGLMVTMTAEHDRNTSRGYGTYLSSQPIEGTGIRNAPYSTDLGVNPFTYGISNNTTTIAEPHGIGFIWCTILWEMTWDLIDLYGFDDDIYNGSGGNNIALQLVTDGLKLQPCSPGMQDGRDAILAADEILYGGEHACLIWQAFARRGLGFSASQGSPVSRVDQIEAFDASPACSPGLRLEFTATADSIEAGGIMNYTVTVTNELPETAISVAVVVDLSDNLSYIPGSADCDAGPGAGNITLALGDMEVGEQIVCHFDASVDPAEFSKLLFQDDMENPNANWTISNDIPGYDWIVNNGNANSGSSCWFAKDEEVSTDQYLEQTEAIAITNPNTSLRFQHYFDTEATWDGGVVEISVDGGDWEDLDDYWTRNGYTSIIQENDASAISGRPAFTGSSGEAYIPSIASLGDLAGSSVKTRFRFACDGAVGGNGWYVDDVEYLRYISVEANACVQAQGESPFCQAYVATVIEGNCVAEAGVLAGDAIGADGSIQLTQDIDETITVEVDFLGNDPGAEYDLVYLLTSNDSPYFTIEDYNDSGEFALGNLDAGNYLLWTMSYSTENEVGNAISFLDQGNYEDVLLMELAFQEQGICVILNNLTVSGDRVELELLAGTGIEDSQLDWDLQLAPNPAEDELFITVNIQTRSELSLEVYDIQGKRIHAQAWNVEKGANQLLLDASTWSSGSYFLHITTGSGNIAQQFVKH